MIHTPATVDTARSPGVDTLSDAREMLRLREECDWLIPERELERTAERLDLNQASAAELRSWLPPSVVDRLLALRDSLGGFVSQGDLRHLGPALYQTMQRLRFRLSRPPPTVAIRLRASLAHRDPDEERWTSPWKTFVRTGLVPRRNLRLGVLGEKDAGEPYRYAFLSAHVMLEHLGVLERVIVGDYTVHAGQGLVIGRGGGFRRELPASEHPLPSPHTYADETGYLRGLAITLREASVRLSLFCSAARRAASGGGAELDDSGLFRTPGEQASWGAVKEITLGGVVSVVPWRAAELGVAFYRTEFSPSLTPAEAPPVHRAEGVSLNWRMPIGGSALEGEIGCLVPGGPVLSAFWRLPLERGLLLVALRHYAPVIPGRFSSPPGRGGANEQGGTILVRFAPLRSCNIQCSVDLCRELFRTQRTPMARRFAECSCRLQLRVSPASECEVRWRWHGAAERVAAEDELGRASWTLSWRQRHALRVGLHHAVGRVVAVDARLELVELWSQEGHAPERGWLLSHTITLRPLAGVSLIGRLAIARTASYAARIYLPEHDHNGAGGFVMLYGSGVRSYLFLRLSVGFGLRFSLKYASSWLDPPPPSEYPPGERIGASLVSFQLEGSW